MYVHHQPWDEHIHQVSNSQPFWHICIVHGFKISVQWLRSVWHSDIQQPAQAGVVQVCAVQGPHSKKCFAPDAELPRAQVLSGSRVLGGGQPGGAGQVQGEHQAAEHQPRDLGWEGGGPRERGRPVHHSSLGWEFLWLIKTKCLLESPAGVASRYKRCVLM